MLIWHGGGSTKNGRGMRLNRYAQITQGGAPFGTTTGTQEQGGSSLLGSALGIGSLGLGAYNAGLFGGGASAAGGLGALAGATNPYTAAAFAVPSVISAFS